MTEVLPLGSGKPRDKYLKIIFLDIDGSIAQGLERLSSKQEVASSNLAGASFLLPYFCLYYMNCYTNAYNDDAKRAGSNISKTVNSNGLSVKDITTARKALQINIVLFEKSRKLTNKIRVFSSFFCFVFFVVAVIVLTYSSFVGVKCPLTLLNTRFCG